MAEKLTLADDYIEYFLFPSLQNSKKDKPLNEILEELMDEYLAALSSHLVDYIWQNEPFQLEIVDKSDGKTPPYLHGCTKFGDNIDDEWFIVFLLNELTKRFPDLMIRCIDNDGEFMLIEMADELPKWMNPDTTENRVFLYQGNVHILPSPKKNESQSKYPTGTPDIKEAIALIKEFSTESKCNNIVQKKLLQRIERFPEIIKENQHQAHCYIPAALAVILKQHPSFLPAAVKAFYTRDPIDLKVCQMMRYFPPETRVMTCVTFTKCLYAQLVQQNYKPNKLVGWNIPPTQSPNFNSYDLGMKLACGFEILVANNKKDQDVDLASPSHLYGELRWLRYLKSLKENNYFKGEVEGSKLYQELLNSALHYYSLHMIKHTYASNLNAGHQIRNLLDSIEVDTEQLKLEEQNLPPADDDKWLNVSPEMFDNILQETFLGANNDCSSTLSSTVVDNLKAFVDHTSGIGGVEVPMLREQSSKNNKSNRITLDPDAFADAYQSILDFKLPEWEDGSSSEMSDYSEDDDHREMDLNKPLKKGKGNKNASSQEMLVKMEEYMEQMDKELSATSVAQNFDRLPSSSEVNGSTQKNDEDGLDSFSPVNVDLSVLRNILESYHSQQGLPGPASSILTSMGIQLPQNSDN